MNIRIRVILISVAAVMLANAALADGPFQFYPITPCRVADTRNANGTNGGPKMSSGETRNFQMRSRCGIPTTAKAVSLNLTIAQPTNSVTPGGNSYLIVWPSGSSMPNTSAINFRAGDPPIANGIVTPVSTNTLDLSVFNASGEVHVIIDATGYFQ